MTATLLANPFPGPAPFRDGDEIFGRKREIDELIDRLAADRLVLLYSASGAGKSSLLNAGVLPKMRQRGFGTHQPIRVGLEGPADVNRYVWSCATSLGVAWKGPGARGRGPGGEAGSDGPGDAGQRLTDVLGEPADDLFVFDQFEEVLTAKPGDDSGRLEFFKQLGEALRVHGRWAVFAIREDYLAPIDEYLEWLPTQLASRMRITILRSKEAREAICRPVEKSGGAEFEDGAADDLVAELSADGWVEPVQLQVVCKDLWDELCRQKLTVITRELVQTSAKPQLALMKFYERTVKAIAEGEIARQHKVTERDLRDWFGSLIAGKTRIQLVKGETHTGAAPHALSNEVVRQLEDAHLVRSETRRQTWCELTHDSLIYPVSQSNAIWNLENLSVLQRETAAWVNGGRLPDRMLRGKSLRAAGKWARRTKEALHDDEKTYLRLSKRARRRRRTLIVSGLVALLLLVFLYLAGVAENHDANMIETDALQGRAGEAVADQPEAAAMYALNAEGIPNAQDITDRLVDNLFFSSDITRQQIMVRLALLSATVQRDPRYAGAIPNELRTDEVHCIWFASEGAVSAMVSKDASNALVVQAFDVETLKPSANAPSSGCPIPATPAGNSAPDVRFTAPAGWTFSEAAGQFELYGPGRTPHYTGKPAGGLSRLVVAPKAKRAAWINRQDSSVYVLDLESRNITSLAAGELPAVSLAFSPDGKILATGGTDGSVRLWWFDLPGAPSKSLPDVPLRGNDTVVELVFSPKGDRLVSQSADGTLVVWRILEKLAPRTAPEMPMAFAPGIRMATASNEKRQLTATMASAPTAPPKTYSPVSVSSIAMRRDGKTALAVTDPSHFEVVDLESGQPVRSPEVAGRLSGGALSDDGTLAAVITGKNSIGVFTLEGGKIAHQYDLTGNATIRCLAFTPTLIVAGEDHNVQSWRLKDREPDNKHARVTPVALSFAPDGKIGAFLNETNGIRFISSPEFWDGVSGTLQMPGHPRSIGFSADGKTFQVLMNDGHAFSWPIDVASMHESACSLLRSTPPPPDPDGKPGFADWCKQPAPK